MPAKIKVIRTNNSILKDVKKGKVNKGANKAKTKKEELKKPKKPKTVVKTILENPFALRWPVISEELEIEVMSQLEMCCSHLKMPDHKPPWAEIQKLRGKDRAQYCQKYKKSVLEKIEEDPDAKNAYEMAKEARSHLILGFNAVMRALEQNRLAGVLLRKDVLPSFLCQMFLPGCVNKHVPVVPLDGLDRILQRDDKLAVRHSVMVLGLRPSAQELTCKFYPLYVSMKKTLENISSEVLFTSDFLNDRSSEGTDQESCKGVQESSDVSDGDEVDSEQNMSNLGLGKYNREDIAQIHTLKSEDLSKYKLSSEEIKSYHLKRPDKSKRVFVPVVISKKAETIDFAEDVISIGTPKASNLSEKNILGYESSTLRRTEKAEENNTFDGVPETKAISKGPQTKDIQYEFFLDTSGDGLETTVKGESSIKHRKPDKKRKNVNQVSSFKKLEYIPAKAKRIKNNPDRKK